MPWCVPGPPYSFSSRASAAARACSWRRGAAWVLIVMLTSAAAGGVCLTYGPDELFALLRNS